MAQVFKIKNSQVEGNVPTAEQLAKAELAVNLKDRKLYTKDADDAILQLAGPGSLTAADVGALPDTTTAADIGALPDTTTAEDIGALPDDTVYVSSVSAGNNVSVVNDDGNVTVSADTQSGTTNLSIAGRNANTLKIASDTGTNATVPAATTELAGLLTATDKTKLDDAVTDAGVTSITAGVGIAVDNSSGAVEISSTLNSFTFGGSVDVTQPKPADTRTVIQELYVNTGEGTFHESWVAVTDDVTTETAAHPGDLLVYEDPKFVYVPTGSAPASDSLWVEANGKLYPADIANNVGIGTDSPQAKLDVFSGNLGNAAGDELKTLSLISNNNNTAYLNFKEVRNVGGADWQGAAMRIERVIDTTKHGFIEFAAKNVHIGNNTTRILNIIDNGNVGIGKSEPGHKLDVAGNIAATGYRIDLLPELTPE